MEKWNITNYEAALLDYYEGELSPEMVTELELFLKNNNLPKLQSVALLPKLMPSEMQLTDKLNLKKSEIADMNYELYVLIAKIEGVATELECADADQYLLQSSTKTMYSQLRQTKLSPVLALCYTDKIKLIKENKGVFSLLHRFVSIAAALVVLAILAFLLKPTAVKLPIQLTTQNDILVPANQSQLQPLYLTYNTLDSIVDSELEAPNCQIIEPTTVNKIKEIEEENTMTEKLSPINKKQQLKRDKEQYEIRKKIQQPTLLQEQIPQVASVDFKNNSPDLKSKYDSINPSKPILAGVMEVQRYSYTNAVESKKTKTNHVSETNSNAKNVSKLIRLITNEKLNANIGANGVKDIKLGLGEFELSYNR